MKNLLSLYYKYFFILLLTLASACGSSGESNEDRIAASDTVLVSTDEPDEDQKVIVFFGNSLTAGYGLNPDQAFPALIQEKIDSLGLDYEVVNAGLSGETTASGKNRVEWILKQEVDVFVLELGANDGLRGINLEETKKNLQEIIDQVKEAYPDAKIVLAGMQIPPSMGADYAHRFKEIFPDLADKNDIYFVPFLLEGVGGEASLNLPDGVHPTAEGHKILAENVWEVLKDIL